MHHGFVGIFCNDIEGGFAYTARWKMRDGTEDALGRTPATGEKGEGARVEGSTPPADGSRTFPLPIFQNLYCYDVHNFKNPQYY